MPPLLPARRAGPTRTRRAEGSSGAAYLDVTRPLCPATPVFPGDPPVETTLAADPARGDPARVTRLTLSTHAGTHVDAPCHLPGLVGGVEELDPSALIGPALVIETSGRAVRTDDVAALPSSPPRVLYRGGACILPAAARALARRGVVLVGTDALSVDRIEDPGLPAHAALLAAGVVVLESLDLTHAPAGQYDLIALPLLLTGGDGAPARVLLRRRPLRRRTRAGPRGDALRRRRPARGSGSGPAR